MGLFDRLRKKIKKEDGASVDQTISPALKELLSNYVGPARQRQLAFGKLVVRGQNWNVDMEKGTISFGNDEYPVQLIGTESSSSNTWLWGFLNQSGFPPTVLKDSEHTFNFCKSAQELADSELMLTEVVNGHNISSIVAAAHKDKVCYFRCPYDGGAAYVLVGDVSESVFTPVDATQVIQIISDLIIQLPVNHRTLVKSLMKINCVGVDQAGPELTGCYADGTKLTISFDEGGRIAKMNTTLNSKTSLEPSADTASAPENNPMQDAFKENLKFIHQESYMVDEIKRLFIQTDNQVCFVMGEADFPTGKLVVADPLAYLHDPKFAQPFNYMISPGSYPVYLAIHHSHLAGLRIIAAKLKIAQEDAVRYEIAMPEGTTIEQLNEPRILAGFCVDTGLASFCDKQVAEEYGTFLADWKARNPNKNHYDDYFAGIFAESYARNPDLQRKDGDFIEWAIPKTGNRIAMFASGLGDGFYQSLWGFDENNNICELVIPFMNPDFFK